MRWFDSDATASVAASDDRGDPLLAADAFADLRMNGGTDQNIGVQENPVGFARDRLDLGLLEACVRADTTDLLVNGHDSVWVDSVRGLERVEPPPGLSEDVLRVLAARLVSQGGRHLDHASPCVDARLHDGVRVHAAIPPISPHGTVLSIRFPRESPFTLGELVDGGSLDEHEAAQLEVLVRERANVLVTGAAGVGKTTLLSALMALVPAHERIVTIEDVAEIRIAHPHVVSLESRQANVEGAGEVGLARLVREALRMRPDRLVLGECRGEEVRDMLMALGSGHDGGASTLHARSLGEVGVRLETLGALAGLNSGTLTRMVECAIDAVVHLERVGGRRRIAAIGRPVRVGDEIRVEPLGGGGAR